METLQRLGKMKSELIYKYIVPEQVKKAVRALKMAGHDAHIVGGPVRDILLGREPNDWDLATDALPGQVMEVFDHTVPTGVEHGTVTVIIDGFHIEVTTYRVESEYSDYRRPDEVDFVADLKDDLARRDFTFNAMALTPGGHVLDYFGGIEDLKRRLIRAVGDPLERFEEDPLRMMRAIRFAGELSYGIERETYEAIKLKAQLLPRISWERIRDEFSRCLLSPSPGYTVELFKETGLLEHFLPELLEGVEFKQNEHHRYTVWQHSLLAVEKVPAKLHLRLATLLHDVAKPRCLTVDGQGKRHFYHHEIVGAEMAADILRRLRYDNDTIDLTCHLIRHHLALHHYPDMSDAAVRRLINRVGLENLDDLILLRYADRNASGTKKGPVSGGTKLLLERIERVLVEDAAFDLGDLAVDGHDVMEAADLEPGPLVGEILDRLLEMVLDNPDLNEPGVLKVKIQELAEKLKENGEIDG